MNRGIFLNIIIFVFLLFSCKKEKNTYDIVTNVGDTVTINLDFMEGTGNYWNWSNRDDVKSNIDTINLQIISSNIDGGIGQYYWKYLTYKNSDCFLIFNTTIITIRL
ncbi:MAG: hypothetical protein MI739_01760 [Bacteroidales bacterium]|nr:hypothetical protein [Bacteroidales bacterium]